MRFTVWLRRFCLSLLVLGMFGDAAFAATVRGRLDRRGPYGFYPAAGVAVTVNNPQMGRSSPAYTGTDGMYYLFNIPPGNYTLEIWPYPQTGPLLFPVTVNDPGTDVPPILVP